VIVHFQAGEEEGEGGVEVGLGLLETRWCDMTDCILQLKQMVVSKLNQDIEKISLSFHGMC
jgi:hypothetical protein